MLSLLASYLSGRKQYIRNGDIESILLDVVCGVPQGSVLGPLLFILYINDIVNITSLGKSLYADDAAFLASGDTVKKLQKTINKELPKIFSWLSANKLTLNYSKTKYMLFGYDKRKNEFKFKKLKFRCNINKNAIKRVCEFKYLGVFIDEKLNWQKHINYIQSKLAKVSGVIYKLRRHLSIKTTKMIYNSLGSSYLNYGITAWGNCPTTTLGKVQVSQNKVIRSITSTPWDDSVIHEFKIHQIMNVKQIYIFETAKFMYNTGHLRNPDAFQNYFPLLPHTYSTNYREAAQYSVPQPRTDLGKRSISYDGVKIWKKIPSTIKRLTNYMTFKQKLKEFIFVKDIEWWFSSNTH